VDGMMRFGEYLAFTIWLTKAKKVLARRGMEVFEYMLSMVTVVGKGPSLVTKVQMHGQGSWR